MLVRIGQFDIAECRDGVFYVIIGVGDQYGLPDFLS